MKQLQVIDRAKGVGDKKKEEDSRKSHRQYYSQAYVQAHKLRCNYKLGDRNRFVQEDRSDLRREEKIVWQRLHRSKPAKVAPNRRKNGNEYEEYAGNGEIGLQVRKTTERFSPTRIVTETTVAYGNRQR